MTLIALSDPAAADAVVSGGKAATLAQLLQSGYPVPDGWVIPAEVTASMIGDRAWLRRLSAEVDGCIDGPVAIRSSALSEDLADASFAGMYVTVLDVSGAEAIASAIERCLGAAEAERVGRYAGSVRLDPPALLIQRMVPAAEAGVAFTLDPVTGADVIRVSAVHGLGDALVDGTADPEDWTIDPATMIATSEAPTGVLDERRAVEVARLAARLAEQLGAPQDVEWAADEEGLHLLQARPITVVPVEPDGIAGTGWSKDEAHYPEPITPFGFSVGGPPVMTVFADAMLRPYGLVARSIEYEMVGGEAYMRIAPLFGSADSDGRKAPPRALLWLISRLHPGMRSANRRAAAAVAGDHLQREFDRWADEWRPELEGEAERRRAIDLPGLDASSLAAEGSKLLDLIIRGAEVHFRLFMPYAVPIFELDELCRRELAWSTADTMRLLVGLSPASVRGRDELAPMAQAVAADPRLADALQAQPRDPVAALGPIDAGLSESLAGWFERHGWRCLNYDPGSPTLVERPEIVARMLLAGVEGPPDGALTRDAAEAEARAGMDGTAATEFDERLAAARRAYPVREENVVLTDNVPNGLMRRWVLEAGRRLLDGGIVSRLDDVVYLTFDEIVGALMRQTDANLSSAVARRKGEEAWVRAHPGPRTIGEPDEMPDVTALPAPMARFNQTLLWMVGLEYPADEVAGEADAIVTGNPASPGVVTGPARIVLGEADFHKVGTGDIMVCPITTPAWTMLFSTARGVVTDAGGVLSHAAIVAREHGIPAVIGASGATTTISDGQLIRIDGTSGRVTVA